MSSMQRNMQQSRMPPKPMRGGMGGRPRHASKADFQPKMWSEFFAEKADVRVSDTNVFRVYFSKPPSAESSSIVSPLLVLLHGGGYSALTWAHFSVEITQLIHCQCAAIDLRGHGDTAVDDENDLSAETLASDVAKVVAQIDPEAGRPVMLIGHSMGGAICVHVAARELIPALLGCVVIDVVEGTAMESLASMQSFLRSRPKTFRSIAHAIEWSVLGGQIRNVESAAVSMPGQIVNTATGKLGTNDLPLAASEEPAAAEQAVVGRVLMAADNAIAEDAEVPDSSASNANGVNASKYAWRIDLARTEPHWSGWFSGLSDMFLNLRVPKLLLLANINGLDRALTVGQMQGRFQLQVLARSGHVVHEDQPHEVAELVGTYLVRNRFAVAVE